MTRHRCNAPAMAVVAVMMMTGLSASEARGQGGMRQGASPLAPGDLSKPIFDTVRPHYAVAAPEEAANTVVAEVDGEAITLGDVGDAIRALPASTAALPYEMLFPSAVDQLVRRKAIANRARQLGVDEAPIIRRRVKAATDQILAQEMLFRDVLGTVTETALLDRYRRDFEKRPGPEEVRARIIVTVTSEEAIRLIRELRAGADFPELAKRSSRDPSASRGGEVGFLARDGISPEVGAVAFALPVGEINAHPVFSRGAWFIIKAEERRTQPTPSFAGMREPLTQLLVHEGGPEQVRKVLAEMLVRTYSFAGAAGETIRPAEK